MNILTVIPARGGSKGVPGKNIKLLGNKPLIAYSIESALQAGMQPIVNTESEQIADIAAEYGAQIYLRPQELASDKAKSIDVILEMLPHYAGVQAVLLLQPTTPFRKNNLISQSITTMEEQQLDSLISVLPVPDHFNPHWVFEPNAEGKLKIATGEDTIISRRQELPSAFIRDGAIYLTKVEVLKKATFFGQKLGYVQTEWQTHVNIDTLEDWEKAEKFATNFFNK